MWGRLLLIGGTFLCAASAAAQESAVVQAAAVQPAVVQGCVGTGSEALQVARVTGERSFTLADGREIVLAGIDVPPAHRTRLEGLVLGRQVVLIHPATADRYGRIPAFVRTDNTLLQGELIARGHARIAARIGAKDCAAELRAAEAAARAARVGLWADPEYAVAHAEDGPSLLAARGRFAVAEGQVLSVRETGGTIYVNFGRRWSEALTVTILKRHERMFAEAGLTPKALEKRRIRVRGTVEARNGPRIEVTSPEQIEVAERN